MKNNDSISQHGLFCFTKGPGGWRGAGAGRCVAGLPMMPDAGEGWPLWPGLGPAGQRTGGPPGAVITRNKM